MRRRAFRPSPWRAPLKPGRAMLSPPVACACHVDANRPKSGRIDPRSASLGVSGEPSAAELCLRRELAADPRSLSPGRPIGKQRPGLGRGLIRSEPLERDPTAEIWRYRFSRALLHKSPFTFLKSTRHPG